MQPPPLPGKVPGEPRSFAPRRRDDVDDGRAMKIDPVTEDNPTASQLARGINQVHACVEDEKRKAAKHRRELTRRVTNLGRALGGPDDEPDEDEPARDTLFARLKRIERGQRRARIWLDRVRTVIVTLGIVLPPCAAIVWWLAGARIAHLLQLPPGP